MVEPITTTRTVAPTLPFLPFAPRGTPTRQIQLSRFGLGKALLPVLNEVAPEVLNDVVEESSPSDAIRGVRARSMSTGSPSRSRSRSSSATSSPRDTAVD